MRWRCDVFQAALDQYDADPCSWASDGARGGEALMAYQSTPATKGRGVVVPSFVADGAVRRPDPEARWRCGIYFD